MIKFGVSIVGFNLLKVVLDLIVEIFISNISFIYFFMAGIFLNIDGNIFNTAIQEKSIPVDPGLFCVLYIIIDHDHIRSGK